MIFLAKLYREFYWSPSAVILTVYIKNGKIMSTKGIRGGMNAGYNTNRMHQPAAQYPVFFSYYLIYINLLRKGEITMVSQKVTINNPQGLHMRPAGVFAKGMAKFDSDVTINFNGKATNGKSLLNIIGACIKCGSEVEIQCDGADEEEALKTAIEMIESGLGE